MNSPFVQARAKGLAARLRREATSEDEQIGLAFQLCFGRLPDGAELKNAAAFLDQFGSADGQDDQEGERGWEAFCQALLATAEFRNLD
jgi:hypothetical protein